MSWNVQCGDKIVWQPASIVGSLFLREVAGLERLFGLRSGILDEYCDEMSIEAPRLEMFLNRAFDFLEHTNHGALFAMVEGCLAICILLSYRITGQWPEASDRLRPLVEKAKTVMTPIPLDMKPDENYWAIQVETPTRIVEIDLIQGK